ncbi:unnamed protein product [Rangifer tarandus platyrhynchus]|uniref:Uncharacterized protein n=1 Tax=Rangifer tarandus platyrhynchus TaxID=3082113 RepID=A0AC59ZAS4_RANTA
MPSSRDLSPVGKHRRPRREDSEPRKHFPSTFPTPAGQDRALGHRGKSRLTCDPRHNGGGGGAPLRARPRGGPRSWARAHVPPSIAQ